MSILIYAGRMWLSLRRASLVLAGILLLFSLVPDRLFAQGLSSWTEGEYPELILGDHVGYPLPQVNHACADTTFYYLSYTDSRGNSSKEPRLLSRTQCMTSNSYASAGAGYFVMGSYGYVVRHAGQPANIQAVPAQHKLLWLRSPEVFSYGRSVSFVDNLLSIGETKPFYGSVLAHGIDITYPTAVPTLRDSDGVEISIVAYNFSSNGEWMIAEALSLGFLRINTRTYEMQLISEENFRYGYGYLPSATLAISNDGNYVMKSGRDVGPTTMYDLTQCNPASGFRIRATDNSAALQGCKSRSIQQNLTESTGGSVVAIRSAEFLGDGFGLRGVTTYINPDGVREFRRFVYHVAGYEIPTADYLALGDSFSSGEGAYDYETGTDSSENKCHLSRNSYPYLLDLDQDLGEFHSVACSGALISELRNRQDQRDYPYPNPLGKWLPGVGLDGQLGYTGYVDPRIITISIGGNDVGFADVLKSCIGPGTCSFAKDESGRAEIAKRIARQYDRLVTAYGQIAEKTSNKTKIFVISYPQFIGDKYCESNTPFDAAEITLFRNATHYLNQVAKAAAEEAGVYFVDIEEVLGRNNLCSNSSVLDMAVNGLTAGDDSPELSYGYSMPTVMGLGYGNFDVGFVGNESFHPNKKGHKLMAEAIGREVQNSMATFDVCPDDDPTVVVCPRGEGRIPYPEGEYFGKQIGDFVDYLNTAPTISVDIYRMPEPVNLIVEEPTPPRNIHIYVQDLSPGSIASVVSHSDPVVLGEFTVPDNGILDVIVPVPDSVDPGYHTLHVYATTMVGGQMDYYQTMIVTGPEGDIDGDGIGDLVDPCNFVAASGVDEDFDGVDDACDGMIDFVDDVAPVVTGYPQQTPNESGWYATDVAIDWVSLDPEPSSGVPTSPSRTYANVEGEHVYTSEESCDPAANCTEGSLVLRIDKTAPVISDSSWTQTPKPVGGRTMLSLHASDAVSRVAEVEYYLDDADPGMGKATRMEFDGEVWRAEFADDVAEGVHEVTIRAVDMAGNWSEERTDYLVVYNPAGPSVKGRHWLYPRVTVGDTLPGLLEDEQKDKLMFGFLAAYNRTGEMSDKSDLQLTYSTGKNCSVPDRAENCHALSLRSTSIDWLVFSGLNSSVAIFEGRGMAVVDGRESSTLFRVRVFDSSRVGMLLDDEFTIEIFEEEANPSVDSPRYRSSGFSVGEGGINIYQNPVLSSSL